MKVIEEKVLTQKVSYILFVALANGYFNFSYLNIIMSESGDIITVYDETSMDPHKAGIQ